MAQNVLLEITKRYAHVFRHWKEMGMFSVHHLSKLNLSLNVVSITIVLQKWPVFKSGVRILVYQPTHVNKENSVMFCPHHLEGRLLHVLVPMDSCLTTKATVYQVCHPPITHKSFF